MSARVLEWMAGVVFHRLRQYSSVAGVHGGADGLGPSCECDRN